MDLCDAAGEGDLNRMQLLLEQGADKGMYDRFGFTPLCIGCWNGHLDVVQHLVSSVDEQATDKDIDKLDGSGMFFFPLTSFIPPFHILSLRLGCSFFPFTSIIPSFLHIFFHPLIPSHKPLLTHPLSHIIITRFYPSHRIDTKRSCRRGALLARARSRQR